MIKKQKHSEKILISIVVGPMKFSWKLIKPHLNDPHVRLFFVDGGLVHLEKFEKFAPHLVQASKKLGMTYGDGDSSHKKMDKKKTDQNISDLAFFLKTIPKSLSTSKLLLIGFLGGRLDHQLFNLGEVNHYMSKHQTRTSSIWMEDKIQFLCSGEHHLWIEGPFSLASFTNIEISVKGECNYKTKGLVPLSALSSRGLSNKGQGLVEINSKGVVAVIYP